MTAQAGFVVFSMVKMLPIPEYTGYFAGEDGNIYSSRPMGSQKGIGRLRKLKPNILTSGRYFMYILKETVTISRRANEYTDLFARLFMALFPTISA